MSTEERDCSYTLNAFHSVIYFSDKLDRELAGFGITDPMAAYLTGRAAPLGAVSAGVVTAAFNAFAPHLVAEHIPTVWSAIAPGAVVSLRLAAADRILDRLLTAEALASAELAEAAELAMLVADACERPGRPMFSANRDLPIPEPAHLRLWHAATLLREYRGDAHLIALGFAELDGLDALVSHCASPSGMPKAVVITKRGWTEADWSASEERLRQRGFMNSDGALTAAGLRAREHVEEETDRLSRSPYRYLGSAKVSRLYQIVHRFVVQAAGSDAFPAELRSFFVPAAPNCDGDS